MPLWGYCMLPGGRRLIQPPVFPRRHAEALLENAVKGALAGKAGVFIGFCDALVRVAEQMAHVIKADIVEIAVKIGVKCFGKYAGKRAGAVSKRFCHSGKRDFLCKMSCNIGDGTIDNIVAADRAFFGKTEMRHGSCKDDLCIGMLKYISLFFISGFGQPVQRIGNIRVNGVGFDNRIPGTELLQGGLVASA